MLHVPPLCNTPTVFFCKFYYWEVGKGERPKLFSNFSLEKCYRETLNKKKSCDNNDLIWIILPGTVSSSFSNGAWEKKLPADWDESDTIDWLFTVANKLGIPCEYFASFSHLRGNEQKRMEIFKKKFWFSVNNKKKTIFYTGANFLEMNKEDFQLKYPNHGHKFYEAFRQLVHQIQIQQQQQHSPAIIENNATDLLGLQSTSTINNF